MSLQAQAQTCVGSRRGAEVRWPAAMRADAEDVITCAMAGCSALVRLSAAALQKSVECTPQSLLWLRWMGPRSATHPRSLRPEAALQLPLWTQLPKFPSPYARAGHYSWCQCAHYAALSASECCQASKTAFGLQIASAWGCILGVSSSSSCVSYIEMRLETAH